MFMRIAKIIKSNSHIDYAARILDSLETNEPPRATDYYFGQFVKISGTDCEIIGIIYNSQLINPEYGNYGPRLSTPPELNSVFSPDYLNEQGVLIGILMLGWQNGDGRRQGVPPTVLPINSEVEAMTDEEVRAFHHDRSGSLQIQYFSQIMTHAGAFADQLLRVIADRLEGLTTEKERARLIVLRRSLVWQQTIGRMR
jgi:hypothetical protein